MLRINTTELDEDTLFAVQATKRGASSGAGIEIAASAALAGLRISRQ
jgi:hypothetical protein